MLMKPLNFLKMKKIFFEKFNRLTVLDSDISNSDNHQILLSGGEHNELNFIISW